MLNGSSGRLHAMAALMLAGSLVWSQCAPAPASSGDGGPSALLGDMTPVVSVKELMADMIDPASDYIFDAVWSDATADGIVTHQPETDEDWAKVRMGAVTLAEGIYLLKVRRPFAPDGDVNDSVGPDAPELSPTEIQTLVDKDPVLWDAKVEALRNSALEILETVKRRDVDALFMAGGDLDRACEQCHLEYWYPGDKALRYGAGVTIERVEGAGVQ
jgi:hypothetical protein